MLCVAFVLDEAPDVNFRGHGVGEEDEPGDQEFFMSERRLLGLGVSVGLLVSQGTSMCRSLRTCVVPPSCHHHESLPAIGPHVPKPRNCYP